MSRRDQGTRPLLAEADGNRTRLRGLARTPVLKIEATRVGLSDAIRNRALYQRLLASPGNDGDRQMGPSGFVLLGCYFLRKQAVQAFRVHDQLREALGGMGTP